MSKLIRTAALGLLVLGQASANGQELSVDEMRSLDGQVQEIKSDVLNIASELSALEERLLYPSNTQLALFVSLEDRESFRLSAWDQAPSPERFPAPLALQPGRRPLTRLKRATGGKRASDHGQVDPLRRHVALRRVCFASSR